MQKQLHLDQLTNRQKYRTSFGSIKMNWIIMVYMPIVILTPCYTYYQCVIKNKQCKPFPHSTITQTANHYPQNTVFRLNMGIASSILVLIFYMIFRWINNEAIQSHYKPMSKILFYWVAFAMVTYCIAVQTIDGLDNGPLHTPSAIIFFIIIQIMIVYVTTYLYFLKQWNARIISKKSLNIKILVALYATAVWLFCLYKTFGPKQNSVDYTVVVQWNAFIMNLLWIFSFAFQFKKINLTLKSQ